MFCLATSVLLLGGVLLFAAFGHGFFIYRRFGEAIQAAVTDEREVEPKFTHVYLRKLADYGHASWFEGYARQHGHYDPDELATLPPGVRQHLKVNVMLLYASAVLCILGIVLPQ